MLYISSRLMCWLIFSLVECANSIFVSPDSVLGENTKSPPSLAPKVDHILLEVSDLRASIAFYRDLLGLRLKSQSRDFVTLESRNVGVFLWSGRWDWEKPRTSGERQGLGMYPHFEVSDAATSGRSSTASGLSDRPGAKRI